MKQTIGRLLKDNKQLMLFIILLLTFRSAIADWNLVPTGSMLPTINEGDVILVNRLAYDLKLPFSNISLFNFGTPERGDIIIFNSNAADNRLVKRVIGVPGDTISLHSNHISINGEPAKYKLISETEGTLTFLETVADFTHGIKIKKSINDRPRNFISTTIPTDYYFVLGDNRDNSADSRVYGLVPHSEIIGRSKRVLWSYNFENYYIPRKDRFLRKL